MEGMFLSGTLEDFPPADVLQLLSFSMQSGVLRYHGGSSGRLWFDMGDLYCGETESGPSLEDRLAARGAVSRGQWSDAVRRAGPQFAVGAELVRTATASEDELRAVLHHAICCAVLDLLRTRSGRFEFDAGQVHVVGPVARFTVDEVVTEVRQRLDEIDAVARSVSPDLRVEVVAKLPAGMAEVVLSSRQWALVAAAGDTPTVADLARLVGRGRFDTARAVYELVERGLLSLVEADPVPEPAAEAEVPAPGRDRAGPLRRLVATLRGRPPRRIDVA